MDPRIAARRRSVAETRARGSMTRILYVLAAVAIVGLVAWVLLRAPLFAISSIDVAGRARASVDRGLADHGIALGLPMIRADLAGAVEAVEKDPWVEGATVVRQWPDTVVVTLTERTPAAIVKCAGGETLAAEDGTLLPSEDPLSEAVGVIDLPAVPCADLAGDLGAVMGLEFLTALPDRIARATEISSSPDGMVATVSTYLVRLGAADEGEEKALALVAVLADPPAPGSVITLVAPTRPAVLPPQDTVPTTETTAG